MAIISFNAASAEVVSFAFAGANTGAPIINVAIGYKLNDFAGVINGGAVQTDNSGAVPIGLNLLNIGSEVAVAQLDGHMEFLRYYNNYEGGANGQQFLKDLSNGLIGEANDNIVIRRRRLRR